MAQGDSLDELVSLPVVQARASLADVVYQALCSAVTSGTLKPGFQLRENALARHFGTSSTPVREALRRLDREGLVKVQPNVGTVVAAYNLREVTNLYTVREVLECHAIRCAAEASRPHDFERVDRLLADAEGYLDAPDQVAFNHLDVELHRAMNDLGGNEQLAELAERVQRQIQGVRMRCSVYLAGRPAISHAEHQAVVEAVRTRDASRAETLLRAHIQGVRNAVARVLMTEAQEDAA